MARKTTPEASTKTPAPRKSAPKSAPTVAAKDTASPPTAAQPTGKLAALVTLMQRDGGATLIELQDATGWQAHSVRGALAGALKKKHGLTIISTKTDGVRYYSVPSVSAAR